MKERRIRTLDATNNSPNNRRLSRRDVLRTGAAVGLAAPILASPTAVARSLAFQGSEDPLAGEGEVVVYSNGGSFTEGVRREVFEPFTELTGIEVIDVTADFAEPQVKAMFEAGNISWDTAFIQASLYPEMHAAGMFEPIDYGIWDEESLEGVPDHARLEDAVVEIASAMLLAYDTREFSENRPQTWADFWDVEAFPGPRGLYAPAAKHNIEFALQADGVPKDELWPLTDDKIDRAFAKLDEIRPHVTKWWEAGGESPQLLTNQEYVMTNAFDGRAISAIQQGAPIGMVWDGAHVNFTYWAILKGGPNTENAQKLIAYVNRAEPAAGWTLGSGYPGPNVNQLEFLPPELVPMLSINPENAELVVLEDSAWLAEKRPDGTTNLDHIQERWLEWKTGAGIG
jgi:putative spermidine/putrescine transport system substrate-binding protein/mannopine transport system substrate-binding protein